MESIQYTTLISRLDEFIRKFYRNLIIRGALLWAIIWLISFVLITVIQYYGNFAITSRTIIFFTFVSLIIATFAFLIIIPGLRSVKLIKTMDYFEAAKIISAHFKAIEDRMINALELAKQNQLSSHQEELVLASIDQKIATLSLLPFKLAINKKLNYKYFKYFLATLIILGGFILFSPSIFSEGTKRLVNYNKEFAPILPFQFILLTDTLDIQKGKDVDLIVQLKGKYIPEVVFIEIGNNQFKMSNFQNNSKSRFLFKIQNVNNSFNFRFMADGYYSSSYKLNVLPTPLILNYVITARIPVYIGESDRTYNNLNEITVPCGTILDFKLLTNNVDSVVLSDSKKVINATNAGANIFTATYKAIESKSIILNLQNKYLVLNNSLQFSINVVPDLFPEINVEFLIDSLNPNIYYFKGIIRDDYGFRNLKFLYGESKQKGDFSKFENISINKSYNSQEFYQVIDFINLNTRKNETIQYCFEIWDNDGVNGSKSTRTKIYEFNIPTFQEISETVKQQNQNIEDKIQNGIKLVNDIQSDINKLQQKSVNENVSNWEKNNMISDLLKKQNQLDQLLQEVTKENKQKDDLQKFNNELSDEILQKQKELQEMMDKLMTDEFKKLLDDLRKLMDQFNQKNMMDVTEKMKLNYDDLSKQLNKNLELMKRFEVEQNIENTIEELKKLAEEQKQIADKLNEKNSDKIDLLNQHQLNQQEFNYLMEQYKETLEKNQNLEKPMNLSDFTKEQTEIQKEMNETKENLEKDKKSKSQKNLQKSSEKMQQLSDMMLDMLAGNQSEQNSENEEDLRQILDNLIQYSKSQEDLIERTKNVFSNDPRYQSLITQQKKLNDDFSIIEDSLAALAKRTPQINTPINTEILNIKENTSLALSDMNNRQNRNAAVKQQFSMTSANNLSLLLSEVLDQMQSKQSGSSSGGSKTCKKKGQGEPSLGDLKNQQEMLKKQMEQMLKDMQNGQQPGQKNKGLAEMLSQQEIFEKMLQDIQNGQNPSPEITKQLNEIKRLNDQNKTDVIENNLNTETILRQQQILTRLLEAEKSQQEREQEKKRESKEAGDKEYRKPEDIFKLKKKQIGFDENINHNSIKLQNYYKFKYDEYLRRLK